MFSCGMGPARSETQCFHKDCALCCPSLVVSPQLLLQYLAMVYSEDSVARPQVFRLVLPAFAEFRGLAELPTTFFLIVRRKRSMRVRRLDISNPYGCVH